jgi:ABC-type antimicrobial peptide transport system permease subunit
MSFMTTMRAQEIAIRRALGATGLDVVRLVVRDALTPAAAGVVVGSIATPLAMRLLGAAVFGVHGWDVDVVAYVAAGLIVLCIAAAALPAWRAAQRFDLPRG